MAVAWSLIVAPRSCDPSIMFCSLCYLLYSESVAFLMPTDWNVFAM